MGILTTEFGPTLGPTWEFMEFYMDATKKRPVFFMCFKGMALFSLFFCLFSLFLYAAGTRQGFTDAAQIFLLRLSLNSGLALIVCSVCGVCFCLLRVFRGPRLRRILMAGAYLCLGAFGVAVSLLASFIIAAAGGNI
jgi:hypothetical protein